MKSHRKACEDALLAALAALLGRRRLVISAAERSRGLALALALALACTKVVLRLK